MDAQAAPRAIKGHLVVEDVGADGQTSLEDFVNTKGIGFTLSSGIESLTLDSLSL